MTLRFQGMPKNGRNRRFRTNILYIYYRGGAKRRRKEERRVGGSEATVKQAAALCGRPRRGKGRRTEPRTALMFWDYLGEESCSASHSGSLAHEAGLQRRGAWRPPPRKGGSGRLLVQLQERSLRYATLPRQFLVSDQNQRKIYSVSAGSLISCCLF